MPFEIPESWVWCRLGEICEINPKNNLNDETMVSFIPMTLILDGFSNKHTSETRRWAKVKKGFTHFQEGDVGIAKITPCFENRKSVILNNLKNRHGAGTTELHILRPIFESFLSNYIIWFVKTEDFIINGINSFTGAVGQQRVGKDIIEETYLPLPPLAELKRIVFAIESAFVLIDKIETNKQDLTQFIKQVKSKVLDLAIHGKLVPQDPNDEPASALLERIKKEQKTSKVASDISHYPFEVPESWVWTRLNEIANVSLGKTLDKEKNKGFFRTYLRSVNVRWGNIDLDDLKEMKFEDSEIERYSIAYGDLLICEGGEAGRCAVWKYENITMRYQNAIHRVRFNTKIVPDFYMYSLWNYHNNNILSEYCKGVTIKHLTGQSLALLYFPLPPLAEQKRIISKIEKIFNQLDEIEKSIKA